MKSFCIKTDNKQIIEYLLNKMSNLNFPDIYYCDKSFKIYDNVILHYKEENISKFENIVASLVTEVVFYFYQEKLLKRLINVNYFYFDTFEKNCILENCDEFIAEQYDEIEKSIFEEVKKYMETKRNIYIEGIVNFRLTQYTKILDNIVDMAVNKYIIEKEYKEFIQLLKIYINSAEPKTEILHLIYTKGESILLDKEKNIIPLERDMSSIQYLSDITFSSNDIALNTLLSMLPKQIEIHVIDKEDEFINTLKLIFESKVHICKECNICKTYRMMKNVKISK